MAFASLRITPGSSHATATDRVATIPGSSFRLPDPRRAPSSQRDEASGPSTCYIKEYPLVVARGQGVMVEDVDGNRYLDFMAGIAVSSTGYSHPKVVVAAVQGRGGPVPPHLRLRLLLRGHGRAVRAAGTARAGLEQEARVPHQLRHRGGRRAPSSWRGYATRPHGDHRLLGVRSTGAPPAPSRLTAQQGAPARRLRAAAARRAPRPVRLSLPLPVLRRQAGSAPAAAST